MSASKAGGARWRPVATSSAISRAPRRCFALAAGLLARIIDRRDIHAFGDGRRWAVSRWERWATATSSRNRLGRIIGSVVFVAGVTFFISFYGAVTSLLVSADQQGVTGKTEELYADSEGVRAAQAAPRTARGDRGEAQPGPCMTPSESSSTGSSQPRARQPSWRCCCAPQQARPANGAALASAFLFGGVAAFLNAFLPGSTISNQHRGSVRSHAELALGVHADRGRLARAPPRSRRVAARRSRMEVLFREAGARSNAVSFSLGVALYIGTKRLVISAVAATTWLSPD